MKAPAYPQLKRSESRLLRKREASRAIRQRRAEKIPPTRPYYGGGVTRNPAGHVVRKHAWDTVCLFRAAFVATRSWWNHPPAHLIGDELGFSRATAYEIANLISYVYRENDLRQKVAPLSEEHRAAIVAADLADWLVVPGNTEKVEALVGIVREKNAERVAQSKARGRAAAYQREASKRKRARESYGQAEAAG